MSSAAIIEAAQNEMTQLTGLQGTWDPATPNPYYTAQTLSKVHAYGGNPTAATGTDYMRTWVPTIKGNPAPVSWSTGAVDQVLMKTDPVMAAAFKEAIDSYIAAQQAKWAATDVCPSTCNGLGTCDATSHSDHCTCTEHAIGRGCSHCGYGWTQPIADGTGEKYKFLGDKMWQVESTPGFDSPLGQIYYPASRPKCGTRCKWSKYWAMYYPGYAHGVSRCYCLGTTTLDELESNRTSSKVSFKVSAYENNPPKEKTCAQPVCNPICEHGGQCVGENECACPKCGDDSRLCPTGLTHKTMTTGAQCNACALGWGDAYTYTKGHHGGLTPRGVPTTACYCNLATSQRWC